MLPLRGNGQSLSLVQALDTHTRCSSVSPIPRERIASPPSRRRRSISPSRPNGETVPGSNGTVAKGNGQSEAEKDAAAKAEFSKMLSTRTGGAYIPPARLRAMQAEAAKDKMSPEYQRLSWDALRKSINGMINKVCRRKFNVHFSIYETMLMDS